VAIVAGTLIGTAVVSVTSSLGAAVQPATDEFHPVRRSSLRGLHP
jgi:hypothetical protein